MQSLTMILSAENRGRCFQAVPRERKGRVLTGSPSRERVNGDGYWDAVGRKDCKYPAVVL